MMEEKANFKDPEELLNLIESGDVFSILSEENMKGFNELMKYELIAVKDDKVYLTPLGKEAQIHGVQKVISRKPVQFSTVAIPEKIPFKIRRIYLFGSLLFLLLAFLFLVLQIIWQDQ